MVAVAEVTEDEILAIGLDHTGYMRWCGYKPKTNINNFKSHFGASPKIVALIWNHLRAANKIIEREADPKHILMACRFLWAYEGQKDICCQYNMSENTFRDKIGRWVSYIQGLLSGVMGTLQDDDDDLIMKWTVDGTHCLVWEPRPFSTKWGGFKNGKHASVNYEIALKIYKDELVWINGPTRPGSDLGIFKKKLMGATPLGKKFIGDAGYTGLPDYICTRNDMDPRVIGRFKAFALARHETFNGKIKNFNILKHEFRHGLENHRTAFDAVCTIVCYEMKHGSSKLFSPYP